MIANTLSRFRYLLFLINFSGPVFASGGSYPALLNSERIAERYGNFGIEILQAENGRRLSSLYSVVEGQKTMRTLALVEFTGADDPRLAAEHARVLAGESIGAVFKATGWTIEKISPRFCLSKLDLEELPELSAMDIDLPASFATHNYIFRVKKGDSSIDYASITEIHHPDYLQPADLTKAKLADC